MAISTTALVLVTTVLILVYRLRNIGRRPKNYPPGPPTLPLIGNIHQIPAKKSHLQFQKWADEYGPIYSLILGTRTIVVLSSDKTVQDLLDKRSNIYSSRPEAYLARTIDGGRRIVLTEYGDKWRVGRKAVHNSLHIKKSESYVPYQDLESKAMLLGLLDHPDQFYAQSRRYSNALTTQILFGFRTTSVDDPKFVQLFQGFEKWSNLGASRTAALLDTYPIFRHLPDALLPMRRYAKELHKKEAPLYGGLYVEAKKKIQEGRSKPCMCIDLVKIQEQEGFDDLAAGYICAGVLEAGSDTTSSTLIGFIQAMLIWPEVAKSAQAEVDRVCGDRIPDLNDLPDLPYIRGCMKEGLRWMPVVILGIPHAVICDDEYMGYKIPKGAEIIGNAWAIHNDPKRHHDPRRFDPTRWAGDDQNSMESASNLDVSKRDHFAFGNGRRICQGIHIADRSLFLGMSRLVWAFDFERPIDEATGEEIIPDAGDLSPDPGLLVQPTPFKAVIKPRDVGKAGRVREEWRKVTEYLDDAGQWKAVPGESSWKGYEQAETVEKM
ncbi:cytochrome P450 [Hypoxylon trugodes]|uniref:cytochrome P450 n=1 Tax=Hypoxylon trugodes TaxID=326681 RepID=UPI00219D5CB5|nr:cytochrome P450 [Hypoxylon trugodes]KAI1390013.1 cytochrome P450 [Hypoxylon trugodes]